MMIGPKTYIKGFEDKSYEELLKEKTKLSKQIEEFENNKGELSGVIISPSPAVVYQCNLEYMAELCNLIAEKYRKRKIQENNDNNTSFEKCMCGNELKINWTSDEKFKMVRCSNCNAEIKFRNPNLIEEKLDDIINKVVNGDPFWENTIKKYFDSLINKNDNDKIKFLKKLVLNKDLFNEFTKEILNSDDSERLFNKYNTKSTVCPSCGATLTFLMPDGKTLYCNKCNKYYLNDNGNVGDETSSPYTRNDVLY